MRATPFLFLASLAAVPAAAQTAGYAGQQAREIKALSSQETADLLAGHGMGLARAGELNGYPGPMHVLELRERLDLTPAQVEAAQASFGRMQAAAKPLGAEVAGLERTLDEAFRTGAVTPAVLAEATSTIGALQGRLRAVHLATHLEMRSALSGEQIALYDRLRGYAGAGSGPAGGHGGRTHPR